MPLAFFLILLVVKGSQVVVRGYVELLSMVSEEKMSIIVIKKLNQSWKVETNNLVNGFMLPWHESEEKKQILCEKTNNHFQSSILVSVCD